MEYRNYSSFVVADIPGLIEGAHEGKGLGHQFLRHIERTRAIAYLIDINEDNPEQVYQTLRNELRDYSSALAKKPALIVLTKIDTVLEVEAGKLFTGDLPVITISSVRGDHLDELRDKFFELIKEAQILEEPQ